MDSGSRREPPLVTAARTGQVECVDNLIACPGIDLEKRDGQCRTALWHAVKEGKDDVARSLVGAGARLYYSGSHDMECPLQLACKTSLLTSRGREMTRYLIRHGANVNYTDHALRNALYWSMYYCCPDITLFLMDAGAQVKPWSWLDDDALPTNFTNDPDVYSRIHGSRIEPQSLLVLARATLRQELIKKSRGRTIYPLVEKLHIGEDIKGLILMETRAKKSISMLGLVASTKVKKKLEKLCNETKV